MVIGSGSLKALYIGCNLSTRPDLTTSIFTQFNLDLTTPPQSYPFERYLEMLDWLRRKLYPNDTYELGYEKIGRAITRGFWAGPVGQVLRVSIGLMGVQKALPFFFRKLNSALPFGKFEVSMVRSGYLRAVLYNVPGPADITKGMALEAMDTAHAIKS